MRGIGGRWLDRRNVKIGKEDWSWMEKSWTRGLDGKAGLRSGMVEEDGQDCGQADLMVTENFITSTHPSKH